MDLLGHERELTSAQVPHLPPLVIFRLGFATDRRAHPESAASYLVSVRHLAKAGGNLADDDSLSAYRHTRRRPPHGLLPHRSCLRLASVSMTCPSELLTKIPMFN